MQPEGEFCGLKGVYIHVRVEAIDLLREGLLLGVDFLELRFLGGAWAGIVQLRSSLDSCHSM